MSDRGERIPATPYEDVILDSWDSPFSDPYDDPSYQEVERRFTTCLDSCMCEPEKMLVICPVHGRYAQSLEDASKRAARRVLGMDVM